MKCRKCGTEFSEGIFCPECGFKNINEKTPEPVVDEEVGKEIRRLAEKERELLEKERRLKDEQERIAEEQHKKEQEQSEKEKLLEAERKRLDAEKANRERTERQAIEVAERAAREKEEAEKRARELEESEKLLKDNEIIDSLKIRLMSTKSQEERRKMLSDFDDGQLNCAASHKRIKELRNKANQKQPHGSMANLIFGVTVILAIIATGILGGTGNADSPFLIVSAVWYGLGIPIWIVWRIVLAVQSRSKKYCLNIKHI